jgi:hypothetical protein
VVQHAVHDRGLSLGPVVQHAVHDRGLSLGHVVRRLTEAFSPGSPFWAEHGYGQEGTPFFSYLHCLVGGLATSGCI